MKSKLLVILLIAVFLGCALSVPAVAAGSSEHSHTSFSFFPLVKPLGITALSCLLITFITGLFRRKLGRRFLKVHRAFAFLTVGIALFHGILVLMLF